MIPNAIHDRFSTDNRGVSPVIGVILMVAITVILAAVIGTFVLDLGQSTGNSAPQASMSYSGTTGEGIEVSHGGGDSIDANAVEVVVDNGSVTDRLEHDGTDLVGDNWSIVIGDTDPLRTGDSWTIVNGTSDETVASGEYDIQVIDTESNQQISSTTVEV